MKTNLVKYEKKELINLSHIKNQSLNISNSSNYFMPNRLITYGTKSQTAKSPARNQVSSLRKDTSSLALVEDLKLKHKFVPTEKVKSLKEILSLNAKESVLKRFEMIKLRSKLLKILKKYNIVSKDEMEAVLNQTSFYSQFVEDQTSKQNYLYNKYIKKLNKFTFNRSSIDFFNAKPFYHPSQDNLKLKEEILKELSYKELELIKDNPSFFKMSNLNCDDLKLNSLYDIVKQEEDKENNKLVWRQQRKNTHQKKTIQTEVLDRKCSETENKGTETENFESRAVHPHYHAHFKSCDNSAINYNNLKTEIKLPNLEGIDTLSFLRPNHKQINSTPQDTTLSVDVKSWRNDVNLNFIQIRKEVRLETRDILIKRSNYKHSVAYNYKPEQPVKKQVRASCNSNENYRDLIASIRNNYRKTNHTKMSSGHILS